MDFEEIKRVWEETDRRLAAVESETLQLAQAASLSRKRTAMDSLRRRFMRFMLIGWVMALYSILSIRMELFGLEVSIAMSVYFSVVALMSLWQYVSLQKICIDTMPVQEVAERITACRCRHLCFMTVLIPAAVGIIAMMIWQWLDDKYMIMALVGGAVIGIAIAIMAFSRFMADYKSLRDCD